MKKYAPKLTVRNVVKIADIDRKYITKKTLALINQKQNEVYHDKKLFDHLYDIDKILAGFDDIRPLLEPAIKEELVRLQAVIKESDCTYLRILFPAHYHNT